MTDSTVNVDDTIGPCDNCREDAPLRWCDCEECNGIGLALCAACWLGLMS